MRDWQIGHLLKKRKGGHDDGCGWWPTQDIHTASSIQQQMSLWEVVVPFDPKMLKNVDFKFSIRTVFCNSQQSILTLHSIHSTSNPSLYCGYEHWPWHCSLSYRLQVDWWLFSDYRLLENEENLEYEQHIWTPWGALWALEKHPCWHLCALYWWVDLKYT